MKKFISLRLTSLIMALTLIFTLAACGGDKKPKETDAPTDLSGQFSTATFLDLPFEADSYITLLSGSGRLYYLYYVGANEESELGTYFVSSTDERGGDQTELLSGKDIVSLTLDNDGNLWILSGDESDGYTLSVYGGDGALIRTQKINVDMEENASISAVHLDEKGNIYLISTDYTTSTTVFVLDNDAQLLFELEKDGLPIASVATKEGKVGIVPYDAANINVESLNLELVLIDAEKKDWSEDTTQVRLSTIFANGRKNSCLSGDTSYVSAWNFSDKGASETHLFNWVDVGVDGDEFLLTELENGNIMALVGKQDITDMSVKYSMAFLDASGENHEVDSRQVLNLATLIVLDMTRAAVVEFNQKNENYKIEIKSYLDSGAYDPDSIIDAIKRLNADIISGNAPDIVDMTNMAVDVYMAKGLLADLYPYIDSDQELNRSDFFENLLEAMSIDSKLPYLTGGVLLYTMMGDSRILGEKQGINIEEFSAIIDQHPEIEIPLCAPMSDISRDTFLGVILQTNLDFIDWETGTCYFDSDEFVGILELAAKLPESSEQNIDISNIDALSFDCSKQIAMGDNLAAIETIVTAHQLASYNAALNGNTNIIGLPVKEGEGHVLESATKWGIIASSKHKDAAWEFIRSAIQIETATTSAMLPITISGFDKIMASVKDGTSVYTFLYPDLEITDADVEMMRELMESVTYAASYDQTISDIVTEEAIPFFAGDVTAKQAAEYIQNKVQIYVNEQF